ncbi:MAG: hypothetical protein ACOC16_00500 [Nanoarchaeota archaeon]
MRFKSNFYLDFEDSNELYYNLLAQEDFNFRTKNIKINILMKNKIEVEVLCDSIIEFKIAHSAIIKSLEVIDKTLKI